MITFQKLKDETVGNLPCIEPSDVENVLEAFMDVLESHGGTIKFIQLSAGNRTVNVGTAGEKSGTGR